ncbi:MAG TPA: hypothetical protein VME46_19935, partial [Acidimicrobiales bacterium]|nr:hypothetical protein [Acidimicrobiales bacterium]
MQGIGVTISPAGLGYLLRSLLGEKITSALEANLTVPPYTMDDLPAWSHTRFGETSEYQSYSLDLSDGQFVSFAPAFASYQQDGSQISII